MSHRLAPEVEKELDDIWWYIAHESSSESIATRVVDSILQRFYVLGTHPHAGRSRHHDFRPGVRSFPVGEYLILYRIDHGDALILHVMHGRRDLDSLLDFE
jgi:toxin ParE1/3/4